MFDWDTVCIVEAGFVFFPALSHLPHHAIWRAGVHVQPADVSERNIEIGIEIWRHDVQCTSRVNNRTTHTAGVYTYIQFLDDKVCSSKLQIYP